MHLTAFDIGEKIKKEIQRRLESEEKSSRYLDKTKTSQSHNNHKAKYEMSEKWR